MRSRTYTREKSMLSSLLLLILILMGTYGYFLAQSITDVLARESVERDIAGTRTAISKMEAQYLALKNAANEAEAGRFGLVEVSEKHFARKATHTALSFNTTNAE